MKRRQLKKEVLSLLQDTDCDKIWCSLAQYPTHLVLNPLFMSLCHPQERIRWNGVLCFGKVVPALAEENIESARVVMRRFLWSLNDESGGIGWGSPESMAEIMCHNAQLRSEYLHMLISYTCEDGKELFQDGNFIELQTLQRGLLWGIGRLCQLHKKEMYDLMVTANIIAYLDSSDPYVAGLALWCLQLLDSVPINKKTKKIKESGVELQLFLENTLQTVNLSQLIVKIP